VIAAAYAGFAGGLLGVLQAFMPPGRLNLRHLRSACDADRNRRRRLKSKKKLSAIPLHAREAAKSEPRNESRSERSTPILQARGLTEPYGGLVGNSDIDFTVYQGELRGIIGPNGAGKTTLFKMLTCEIAPTSGTIVSMAAISPG
jgi:branched-chain amino acid transport system permease protein